MAEESDKEQLQQSGNNRTAHALYASWSIYAATKVGVATKIQILVRPKPDQPDRLLRPCFIPQYSGIQSYYFFSSFEEGEEQEEEEHEEWVAEEEDVMCDGLVVEEDDW